MEKILERNNGEKFHQYVKRLVDGKFKDKTLSDYDHSEIYKAIYGVEVNSSEARKRLYGLRDFFEIYSEEELNNITSNEILTEIEEKKIELEKERKKETSYKC
jgi:predicted transcriptional regulator